VAGSGEDDDETIVEDQWNWTLGQTQYNWFKQTLENSQACYKFVFSHHVTGGQVEVSGAAGVPEYVRGGGMAADYFEWGGNNADDSYGFDTERPGWGDDPIHQLMVDNNVNVYFHGHDHQFVHEEVDGIAYQLVPGQGMSGSGFDLYADSPYVVSGGNLPSAGHIRVTVAPDEATVEYVRSEIGGGGINGQVDHSYTLEPSCGATPAITLSELPLSDFISKVGEASQEQSYKVSGQNLTAGITVTPPADFEISLTSGSGWTTSSLMLSQSGGSVPETDIFVRFNRATEGTSSGDITHASTGATTKDAAVSGTAYPVQVYVPLILNAS
jgi:hypothetical protein